MTSTLTPLTSLTSYANGTLYAGDRLAYNHDTLGTPIYQYPSSDWLSTKIMYCNDSLAGELVDRANMKIALDWMNSDPGVSPEDYRIYQIGGTLHLAVRNTAVEWGEYFSDYMEKESYILDNDTLEELAIDEGWDLESVLDSL